MSVEVGTSSLSGRGGIRRWWTYQKNGALARQIIQRPVSGFLSGVYLTYRNGRPGSISALARSASSPPASLAVGPGLKTLCRLRE